jgi:hypothetical protein
MSKIRLIGLKDTMLLFAIVVTFIELASHVDTYSMRREISVSQNVTFSGTRATIFMLEGSHSIFSKLPKVSTVSKKLVSHLLNPRQQS